MINSDLCLICYEDSGRPYRLQNCGHKFCLQCILDYINTCLGDVTMFPIKCPHCFKILVYADLEALLDKGMKAKLLAISINHFQGENMGEYNFCFTPGCGQILIAEMEFIKCDVCRRNYCMKCKVNIVI